MLSNAGKGLDGQARAAFLGTFRGYLTPVWDTPDGAMPSQAAVNSGFPPEIYTPAQFTVLRQLAGPTAGRNITVYFRGGRIGNDVVVSNCGQPGPMRVGATYLVLIGGEAIGIRGYRVQPRIIQGHVPIGRPEVMEALED